MLSSSHYFLVVVTVYCNCIYLVNGTLVKTSPSTSVFCSVRGQDNCFQQNGNQTLPSRCDVSILRISNSECVSNITSEPVEVCNTPDSCGVRLEVYRNELPGNFGKGKFYSTGFNVTVTNPRAGPVIIHFMDPRVKNSSHCVKFVISGAMLNQNFILWYDCIFRTRSYEGTPYNLQFRSGTKHGLLRFNVPQERELDQNPVLLYVHGRGDAVPYVTFQCNSGNASYYHLRLNKWENYTSKATEMKTVHLHNSSTFLHRWGNLITTSFNTKLTAGNYSVTLSCDSLCTNISSPFLLIKEDSSETLLFFLETIAGLTVLGAAIYIYLRCWRKGANNDRISILLVHNAVTQSHKNRVEALRLFLQKVVGAEVLLDTVDVPNTDHKDPLKWYAVEMVRAKYVGLVIPPRAMPESAAGSPSIYQNTFNLALQLLGPRMSQDLGSSFVIVLEDSNEDYSIPEVCLSLQLFRIPADTSKLDAFLFKQKKWENCFALAQKKKMYEAEYDNCLLMVTKEIDESVVLLNGHNYQCDLSEKSADKDECLDQLLPNPIGSRLNLFGIKDVEGCGELEVLDPELKGLKLF